MPNKVRLNRHWTIYAIVATLLLFIGLSWASSEIMVQADTPVTYPDTATVDEGGTVTVLDGGSESVLDNDIAPDEDELTAALVTGPSHGTLTLESDGTFSYTHNGSETTSDSFEYEACNTSLECDSATVSITITPVNDPPEAVDDTYDATEDTPLIVAAPGVLANDIDADGDTLNRLTVRITTWRPPRPLDRLVIRITTCRPPRPLNRLDVGITTWRARGRRRTGSRRSR